MKKFFIDIADALNMLAGIENALNINDFSPNELRVFYTIISNEVKSGTQSNITNVVESSGMSRQLSIKHFENFQVRASLPWINLLMTSENT